MDDSRATTRYAFRATSATNASSTNSNMNSSGGTAGRSQFHGMDLHTTTPSSHRRAMYISPVPLQSHPVQASPRPTTTMTSGEQTNARQRAEAAAMSARNQVLHRRLSERKRFDSADYAMKMVRRAMQSDTKDDDDMTGDEMPPIATPPPLTGAMTDTVQSPRLSPTHGRLVFAHALGTQDLDCEMKDVSNNQLGSPSPQSTTTPAMRGYGNLQSTKAASAAMSARNLLIQKKLQEKRHFDSADYQLARLGVKTDVAMDEVGKPALDRTALPFARSSSPVTLPMECDVSSPVNSPPATRAAAVRSNQMSPSVRASSGATAFGGRGDASKYGNLGVRAAKTPNDLRRDILLRQQENFIAAQNPVTSTQSSPPVESPLSSAPAPSSNQKYGKLIAANILFRKNLKDRQHFDSADYQMEAAAKQAERSGENDNNATSQPSSSTSNQDDEPHSPVLKPQAKHPKLSDDVATRNRAGGPQQTQQPVAGRGWAAHPAMTRQSLSQGREDNARMAARNVLLSRKLSEGKKRFDSGEYFVAKAEEARAAANRGQV